MISRRSDPVQDAAEAYAAQLVQELAMYPADWIPELPAVLNWSWIFAAELELLRRLPDLDLRRRAWLIYDRYDDVAGPDKATRRATANTLDLENCDAGALRADLMQVHAETVRILTVGYEIERERRLLTGLIMRIATAALLSLAAVIMFPALMEIARWVIGGVALLAIGGAVFLAYQARRSKTPPPSAPTPTHSSIRPQIPITPSSSATSVAVATVILMTLAMRPNLSAQTVPPTTLRAAPVMREQPNQQQPSESSSPGLPLGPLVALAGIFGATFSILQRAQRSSVGIDPVVALFSMRAARRQAYLSIISGVISALVMFCIFAGGMVQGALFPTFVNKWTFAKTVNFPMRLYDFFQSSGPQTHLDHAKLLVWCFIAGFAERFVPDMLDRFTTASKK